MSLARMQGALHGIPELEFALKSRDPYPINLESLVDLLKYKHISSLTTHLKRHFQRDRDYKKFHQVRNKRQICVYYITVDCFKQICGYCRHTQRKEIAQNLLGNMGASTAATSAALSALTMNDVSNFPDLAMSDKLEIDIKTEPFFEDDDDDFKMKTSSPPTKSIRMDSSFLPTRHNIFSATPSFLNPTLYNFGSISAPLNSLAPANTIQPHHLSSITPISSSSLSSTASQSMSITPITTSRHTSAMTSALAGATFGGITLPSYNPAAINPLATIAPTSISTFSSAPLPVSTVNAPISPIIAHSTATFTPTTTTTTTTPANIHKRSLSTRAQHIISPTTPITPTPAIGTPLFATPVTAPISPTKVMTVSPPQSAPTKFTSLPSTAAAAAAARRSFFQLGNTAGGVVGDRMSATPKNGFKGASSIAPASAGEEALFDLDMILQSDTAQFDTTQYLSDSLFPPTSMNAFDSLNNTNNAPASADRIYEQWEQELLDPRLGDDDWSFANH